MKRLPFIIYLILSLLYPGITYAWSEKVHTFVSEKANIKNPEYASIPDWTRDDNYDINAPLHWHFTPPGEKITPGYIDRFVIKETRFRLSSGREIEISIPDLTGVLYWHIVDLYEKLTDAQGWEYKYYVFIISHYIADLSQPLHNYPWGTLPAGDGKIYAEAGAWSRGQHRIFDKRLDAYLPPDDEMNEMIKREQKRVHIESSDDLKRKYAV